MAGIFIITALLFFNGCAGMPDTKDMKVNDSGYAGKLLTTIQQINEHRPDTLAAHPSVTFYNNGRRVSAQGDLYLVSTPRSIRLKLSDPILKFLVADILMTDEKIRMFVPTENTVYSISAGEGILKPGINPSFISSVAQGFVPVISNPSEIKSYSDDQKRDVLELKSDTYEQIILFEKGIPVHTIIKKPSTSEKTEIFFSDPFYKDEYVLFSKIKAFSEPDGSFFEVSCKTYRINEKIDKRNLSLSIPAGVKIQNR
jgi:hypothetical protein